MKHAIILICLVFSLNADAQSQAERPNITLIMADDTTGDTMPKALGQTGKPNGYLTEMFTREAVGFIEQAGNEPFFLYLAYNAVHHPWDVPKSYIDRVQGLNTHEK